MAFNLAERRPVGYMKVYEPPGRREEDDLEEEGHDYDYRHIAKEMTHITSNHPVRTNSNLLFLQIIYYMISFS